MHVTLKPEYERIVDQKVKSGQYASAAEVVEDALARLVEEEEWSPQYKEYVRREAAIGIEQLNRGETADFTAESVIAERRAARAKRGA